MYTLTLADASADALASDQLRHQQYDEQLADARHLWRGCAADLDFIGELLADDIPEDQLRPTLAALRIARAALAHALKRRGE